MPLVAFYRRPFVRVITVALVVAAALITGGWLAYSAFLASPDHVRVIVTDVQSDAGRQQVIFDRTFTDVAPQVYAALIAGKRFPPDATFSCPYFAPTYYHYALTFTHLGATTATADEDATGCALFGVTYALGAATVYSWYDPTDGSSFWAKLNQLTGAPTPINADVTG